MIHIGFLDYTLFHDHPEFYASHELLNVKNYQKYRDNIVLNVVDLSRIDLATEEVKMLTSKDENMRAAETIFMFNTDEQIRKICRDREEYYQDMRNYEKAVSDRDKAISDYKKELSNRKRTISEKDAQIRQLIAENEKLKNAGTWKR